MRLGKRTEDEEMTLSKATLPRGLGSEWPSWEHNE
jgi:hypothetical protein